MTVSVRPLSSEPRPNYRLLIAMHSNPGVFDKVDLGADLWGRKFDPLRDEALFMGAHQDAEMATVVWANGADLAPEYLRDLLHKQTCDAA